MMPSSVEKYFIHLNNVALKFTKLMTSKKGAFSPPPAFNWLFRG